MNVDEVRQQFPALRRTVNGRPAVFLDGPAGSQVPRSVADAVSHYLLRHNANRGGVFASAIESDAVLDEAHAVVADFVGSEDPGEVCFGANMTTITLAVSRAVASQWRPGDEVIVSRLDHDANFTPWVLAAADAGVTVRMISLQPDDGTLDRDDFRNKLSDRTRLVAVGYAANATGTINPVREITQLAHDAGAWVFVDAVHMAPHGRINVRQINCDFLACSAYKFFGPHVGILWGRRKLLDEIRPYKLRPAPDSLPGRWMTGTQNHEGIAGTAAAVEYLAGLGANAGASHESGRSARLDAAYDRIVSYEQSLSERLLSGLSRISAVTVHGIRDPSRLDERVPTVSLTHSKITPKEIALRLADDGIFVWAGNHYAQPYTEASGLEPHGTLRIGALHYNTLEEIDRVVAAIEKM